MALLSCVPLRVTYQCILESSADMPAFTAMLAHMHALGFYGIELNLPEPDAVNLQEIHAALKEHQLQVTYFATGAYAKRRGLSLSHPDEALRQQSVQGAIACLALAKEFGSGMILGRFKCLSAEGDAGAAARLAASLEQVCAAAQQQGVRVLLEATNHTEACVVHTVQQALQFAREASAPLCVLPDTYHMALEHEPFAVIASAVQQGVCHNVHISDDNRRFPGFGEIAFGEVLDLLQSCGFQGTLGIEGNANQLLDDLAQSAAYLASLYTK